MPNLASSVLGLSLRRLSADHQAAQGYLALLAEAFGLIEGEPESGKSVVMRQFAARLTDREDVIEGRVIRPCTGA